MAFQNTVNFDQGFGVVGELAVDGPLRALAGVLDSADPENNVVGRYFTRNSDGSLGAGGTGADGGILANPKTYAAQGASAGGTLAPTLRLRNGEIGEFVQMGEIIVEIDVAAAIGNEIHYNETTGELTAVVPGVIPAGGFALVPHATVSRFAQAQAGGLMVAKLTNYSPVRNIVYRRMLEE